MECIRCHRTIIFCHVPTCTGEGGGTTILSYLCYVIFYSSTTCTIMILYRIFISVETFLYILEIQMISNSNHMRKTKYFRVSRTWINLVNCTSVQTHLWTLTNLYINHMCMLVSSYWTFNRTQHFGCWFS